MPTCAGGLGSKFFVNAYKAVLEGGAILDCLAESRTVFIPKTSDIDERKNLWSRVHGTSKRRSIPSERVDSRTQENRPGLGCEGLPPSKSWSNLCFETEQFLRFEL